MVWWIWLIAGLLLLILELLTPGGFYVFFFGISAILVGIFAGLTGVMTTWVQLLLFSILAVVTALLFRRRLLERFQRSKGSINSLVGEPGAAAPIDSLVGETATALDEIPAGAIGRAELRGTAWAARNIGDSTLTRAQRCRVARLEGFTICVLKETR